MHIGMPTLIELPDITSCAAYCAKLGLDFIELNMNLPQYQPGSIDAEYFTELASKHGLYYTIHLEENLDPCYFNEAVARAYTETALASIELAKKLTVPIINMHLVSGVYFTMPSSKVYLYEKYATLYHERLAAFRDICERALDGADIRICVENPFMGFQHHALDILLESKAFGLTFDIGHNVGNDYRDEPVITRHIDRLTHMHIHDADPVTKKNHLVLGTGGLDLQSYFSLAQQHTCRAVIETKTIEGLRASVNYLRSAISLTIRS